MEVRAMSLHLVLPLIAMVVSASDDLPLLHSKVNAATSTSSHPCGQGALDPQGDHYVWAEAGDDINDRYVGLFNMNDAPHKFDVKFADLKLPDPGTGFMYKVLDLSHHIEVNHPDASFGANLPPRSAALFYVQFNGSFPWPAKASGERFGWIRSFVGGEKACIAMFNLAKRSLKIDVRFTDLGLPDENPGVLEYSTVELLHVVQPRVIPHPPGSFGANLYDHTSALLRAEKVLPLNHQMSKSILSGNIMPTDTSWRYSSAIVLQKEWYNESTGLWDTAGWWNCANSVEALCNVAERAEQAEMSNFQKIVDNTFERTTLAQTLTGRYDDEGWWALAWLRAHDVFGSQSPFPGRGDKYTQRAAAIFDDLAINAWDSTCGGGVWWSYYKQYKNAITNELFLMMALRLYHATGNHSYHDWALKVGSWFVNSGMVNNKYLVNDGLTPDCKNNDQTEWTYNQGVVLGGLVGLSQITGNASLVEEAVRIATATSKSLVYPSGILQETCEASGCDEDQKQFKGIFIRYLWYIMPTLSKTASAPLADFITKNAESVWNKDRSTKGDLGLIWIGPPPALGKSGPVVQTSALEALVGQQSSEEFLV